MKKFISILMVLLIMMVPLDIYAVDQDVVDEYQRFLDSRHDPDNRLDKSTKDAMWETFWKHITDTENSNTKNIINDTDEKSYDIETLAESNGLGYTDDDVQYASINPIWSMAADALGNVYFVDLPTNAIRRYNAAEGSIETFKHCDADFDVSLTTKNGKKTFVSRKKVLIQKLAYNPYNDSIYAGVNYPEYFNMVAKIAPDSISVETFDNSEYGTYVTSSYYNDFIKFYSNGNILYSTRFGGLGSPSKLLLGTPTNSARVIAKTDSRMEKKGNTLIPRFIRNAEAILGDKNTIYVFESFSRSLYEISLYPNSCKLIAQYDAYFDTITSYVNKFYASKNDCIYEISLNGDIKCIASNDNLNYINGSPISQINTMTFDPKGNLIIYDKVLDNDNNIIDGSIRKIKLN
jgi:hypothetical protein